MSEIQEFYRGKNIFITGATGFIGKVLLEKLLRSCEGIGDIYLLVRQKKEKNSQERVAVLLADPVFDVVRSKYPNFDEKVIGLAGDIGSEDLGLSSEDRARIIDNVSVIFHVAATVRFDEPLERAVSLNVNSVKEIVDIAKECKNLKVGVYVSTAFSNCVEDKISEYVRKPPMSYEDITKFLEMSKRSNWSTESQVITEKIIGKWPNTYSYTKAVAEGTIAEYAMDLPFAIYRPSIVLSTAREPVPGWLQGMTSLSAAMAGKGAGVLHTIHVDEEKNVDIVPADMVCNGLIACAWETANTARRKDESIPVYNYVNGPESRITWGELIHISQLSERKTPSNRAIYYTFLIRIKSYPMFAIYEFFFHLVPAVLLDTLCTLFGKKPMFYKLYSKVAKMIRGIAFFTTHDWTFENLRVQNLWQRLNDVDKGIFYFSLSNFDWNEYIATHVLGVRRHLLDDHEDTISQAKKRGMLLYLIHNVVRLLLVTFFLWIIWKFASTILAVDIGMESHVV